MKIITQASLAPNSHLYFGRVDYHGLPAVLLTTASHIIGLGFVSPTHNEQAVLANIMHQFKRKTPEYNQKLIDDLYKNPQLCLIGTDYQLKIWQYLCQIPAGQTTNYKNIATHCHSHPRAVGKAVGANPISGFVPCHRVLASDGQLNGYRWGLAVKQQLLQLPA